MDFKLIIPAQGSNQYDEKLGDLTPFGDVTLLEWKIFQCLEFTKQANILITTDSEMVLDIAREHGVPAIFREKNIGYSEVINQVVNSISEEVIMWVNPTSPFIGGSIYKEMLERFKKSKEDGLISAFESKEYIFYKGKMLNFGVDFSSRINNQPVYIATNGCYIIKRSILKEKLSFFSEKTEFFIVNKFVGSEIRDIQDLSIANLLLTKYIKQELERIS